MSTTKESLGLPQPEVLKIGEDLWLAAAGLSPLTEYIVELRQQSLTEQSLLLSKAITSSRTGRIEAQELWTRTGIAGCALDAGSHGYPFARPGEAVQALADTDLVVVLSRQEAQGPKVIASTLFGFGGIRQSWFPLISDEGCLGNVVRADQKIRLGASSPQVEWRTLFVVKDREAWQSGDTLTDVRSGFAAGQSVAPGEWPVEIVFQNAPEAGHYDVVVVLGRPDDDGSEWPPVYRPDPLCFDFTTYDYTLCDTPNGDTVVFVDPWDGEGPH